MRQPGLTLGPAVAAPRVVAPLAGRGYLVPASPGSRRIADAVVASCPAASPAVFATFRPARAPRARAGLLACAPLVSVLLAACGGAPRPSPTPAPVPIPAAEATVDAAPRATVPRAGEPLPVGRPAPVAAVHEHSPGVSWDLEVHQFEGHERVLQDEPDITPPPSAPFRVGKPEH